MGINVLKMCLSSPYSVADSNPNPKNYKILQYVQFKKHILLMVNYPDAKNFEGNKILIYEFSGTASEFLKVMDFILDPHFSKNKLSPIARFVPTEKGLSNAIKFIEMIEN